MGLGGAIVFWIFWKLTLFIHALAWFWGIILPQKEYVFARSADKKRTRETLLKDDAHAVRFVCLSDIHNKHQALSTIPKGDVLLIAGDLTQGAGTNITDGEKQLRSCNEFLGKLPHKTKIVIAGNHDVCIKLLGESTVQKIFTNAIYLQHKLYTLDVSPKIKLRIFGSPLSLRNFSWSPNSAFQLGMESKALKSKIQQWSEQFPEHSIDILITHGPPFGYRDKKWNAQHAGCKILRQFVEYMKPQYHIFGHVHEAYGVAYNEHTTFINASNSNMVNWVVHPPVVFDYIVAEDTGKETKKVV